PVGALTNKPFRYAARAWELVARPAVAVHDGVGSSVWHHVRRGKILRSVPRECEARNETWLSDRDRYSHLGLYAEDRVLAPQVKKGGAWKTVSWDEAIAIAAGLLRQGVEKGGAELGALMSPSATSEEYFLAQALLRKLGCNNIDHRLREQDFADDPARPVSPAFQMKIADIDHADAVLLIGSNVREEAPILGHRVRQAARRGGKVSVINPLEWPFIFDTDLDAVVAPQHMVGELAALAAAVEKRSGTSVPSAVRPFIEGANVTGRHDELAARLADSSSGVVLLGQFSMAHPQAASLRLLAAYVADAAGCALNLLPHGGNSTGAWLAGALPGRGPGGARVDAGLDAAGMLAKPRQAYFLWDIEPDFDIDHPARAIAALQQAGQVVCVASFATSSLRELADVILPLAPLAESEGSLINFDGTTMSFAAAGTPCGEARAGWKILRRLAGELGLEGFDQVSLQDVQEDMSRAVAAAEPVSGAAELNPPVPVKGLYRVGELPMYSVDALCRRSAPLQQTVQATSMFVGLNPDDASRLGLSDGDMARVRQGDQHSELEVRVTERVPAGAVWLRSATCASRMLESAVAPVTVEAA
ncbi:MAG: molybdopterin-dependent oxidoreductase, partial [Xanthomonadales bacterium]|nr:molybdopterin-dependent oxidoreductase [Xanthomonadales bacterium]